MAVTFVGVGAQDNGTTTISIPNPSGSPHIHDIAVIVIETSGNDPAIAISGWSHVPGSPLIDVATTAGSALNILWKRLTTSLFSTSVTVPGDHAVGLALAFRGCLRTGTPFNVATSTKTTASMTATAPSINVTNTENMVLTVISRPDDSSNTGIFGALTNSNLTSITEVAEAGTNNGNGGGFSVNTAQTTATGAIGVSSCTTSTSTTNASFTIEIIAEKSPSTTLISPAADASLPTGLPLFTFQGADANAHEITYEIQVDTNSSFNSTVSSWNLEHLVKTASTINLGVPLGEGASFFGNGGTKLYVNSHSNNVYEFDLATAYDITTASLIYTFTDTHSQFTQNFNLSVDGTKLYYADSLEHETVYQYNLSTPWSLSTAVYSQTLAPPNPPPDSGGFCFKPDGTKVYFQYGSQTRPYTLSVPWDISSAVYDGDASRYIYGAEYVLSPFAITFNNDGTKYFVNYVYSGILMCSLSTPWIVSSVNSAILRPFVGTDLQYIDSVIFDPSGTFLWVGNTSNVFTKHYFTRGFLSARSDSAVGFSGTPDNISPYPSGQEVSYQTQNMLANGTYYWRVRGTDKLGSNLFGPWSTTRLFTIGTPSDDDFFDFF